MAILRWLVKGAGSWTLLALGLLVLAIDCLSWGIAGAVADLSLSTALNLALFGCLVGWLLARSRLRAAPALAISLGAGAIAVLLGPGQLLNPLISLLAHTWQAGRALLSGSGSQAEAFALHTALANVWTAASVAATRLWAWLSGFLSVQTAYDEIAVPTLWGGLIWLVSAWAAWAVRRRRAPLVGIAPAGIILAALINFQRQGVYLIAVFLGLSLMLLLAHHLHRLEASWADRQIDFSTEMRLDTAFSALPLVLALLIVAVAVPSVSARPVVALAQRVASDRFEGFRKAGESLGLKTQGGPATSSFAAGGLPRSHLLGSGPDLSERLVMAVRLPGLAYQPGAAAAAPRYYWRSLTFDRYTGRGWESSSPEKQEYRAGSPVVTTIRSAQRIVEQEFEFTQDSGGLLYAAGDVFQADQDLVVAWRTLPQPAAEPGDLFGAELTARSYRVKSLVTAANPARLAIAGGDYPAWVTASYLALPDGIPERVLALAEEITAGAVTPFEKAQRIQDYLRAIPYSLAVPAPPPGRDVVDYFLFDLKQGYCDYYATAMVVLARLAGLPARLAVGYATGSYDPAQSRYLVTEAEAHSWLEVYFPGVGWVEFEPTASRSPRDLSAVPPNSAPLEEDWQLSENAWPRRLISPGSKLALPFASAGILLVFALALLLVLGLDTLRLRTTHPQTTLNRLYSRLRHQGAALLSNPPPGLTPFEFSAALSRQLSKPARNQYLSRWQAREAQQVERLAELYAEAVYSPRLPGKPERDAAIQAWQHLRLRLWFRRVFTRFSRA